MPLEIVVPRQGWSMDEGVFVGWLKKDGDAVRAGEPLFTVESDKAAFDVEATDAGVLSIPAEAPAPGAVVKVGARLGYLLVAGEEPPGAVPPVAPTPRAASTAPAAPPPDATAAPVPAESVSLLPAESAPRAAAAAPLRASPRARRAAERLTVDLGTLTPSGRGGRIRERDVLAARPAATPRELPVTTLRRTIAERMMQSRRDTAPVTLTCRCDATQLVATRRVLKAAGVGVVPSYTDIVAKAVADVLPRHPLMAARWERDRIVLPEALHIGIAVDTEHGLLVPVVRDVARRSLLDVAARSRELIEAARARRIRPDDLQGGCFTLTNLGGFGIEAFTPIINPPETAVLGLGAILREPVVREDDTLGVRDQMTLSLTFDHRVVDGAPAARFLQDLCRRLESLGDAGSGDPDAAAS